MARRSKRAQEPPPALDAVTPQTPDAFNVMREGLLRQGGLGHWIEIPLRGHPVGYVWVFAGALTTAAREYFRQEWNRSDAVTSDLVDQWMPALVAHLQGSLSNTILNSVIFSEGEHRREHEQIHFPSSKTPEGRAALLELEKDARSGEMVRAELERYRAWAVLNYLLDRPASIHLSAKDRSTLPLPCHPDRETTLGEFLAVAAVRGNRQALAAVFAVLSDEVKRGNRTKDWRTILEAFNIARHQLQPMLRQIKHSRDPRKTWDEVLQGTPIGCRLSAVARGAYPDHVPPPSDLAAELVAAEHGVSDKSVKQYWKTRSRYLPK